MADPRDKPAGAHTSGVSPDSVRCHLGAILHSRTFTNAPSLSKFLAYIVEASLTGRSNQLKEYTIGVEVFGRGESFDPRIDTIVRAQARRLRSKLEEYYRTEALDNTITIEVAKGRYVAEFRTRPAESDRRPHLSILKASREHDADALAAHPPPSPMRVRLNRPPARLPIPRTRLIGREEELTAVRKLLLSESVRLLTISGAGGSGKTRIALQIASELDGEFPAGVYFIPMATVTDPATVASGIAQALGVQHSSGTLLIDVLPEEVQFLLHEPTLLVIDNFEQVLPAAPLLTGLLDRCAVLKIVVTSRAILDVYGESVYHLLPLPVPDLASRFSAEQLQHNAAVMLFLERAAAAQHGFVLTTENCTVVADICSRLDGLPLAIELAAARIKVLSAHSLLQRLNSRLEFLISAPKDIPARQQTLRRTIDWSHELLSLPERKLFRRLAVFAGGCTMESAEAVCNTQLDLEIDVLEGMTWLLDKNMIQRSESQGPQPRFLMLETIREYALERLRDSGEIEATRNAHAAYCLVIAEEGNSCLNVIERGHWLALCDAEQNNFRSALDWLEDGGKAEWALRLGSALFWFWEQREYFDEGRDRLKAILNLPGGLAPTRERASALCYAGHLVGVQGDPDGALRYQREALDICRALGDQGRVVGVLTAMGVTAMFQTDLASARAWLEESVQLSRALGAKKETAAALSNLAELVRRQNDYPLAKTLLEEALAISDELGDASAVAWFHNHLGDVARDRDNLREAGELYETARRMFETLKHAWGIARSFLDLGHLACEEGNYAAAYPMFEQALRTFVGLRHQRGIAMVLEGFARIAAQEKDAERALTLAGAAAALRSRIGVPPRPDEQASVDRVRALATPLQDPARTEATWLVGWKMSPYQAVQYALGMRGTGP